MIKPILLTLLIFSGPILHAQQKDLKPFQEGVGVSVSLAGGDAMALTRVKNWFLIDVRGGFWGGKNFTLIENVNNNYMAYYGKIGIQNVPFSGIVFLRLAYLNTWLKQYGTYEFKSAYWYTYTGSYENHFQFHGLEFLIGLQHRPTQSLLLRGGLQFDRVINRNAINQLLPTSYRKYYYLPGYGYVSFQNHQLTFSLFADVLYTFSFKK